MLTSSLAPFYHYYTPVLSGRSRREKIASFGNLRTPLINLEDVFLTGLCANQQLGLELTDNKVSKLQYFFLKVIYFFLIPEIHFKRTNFSEQEKYLCFQDGSDCSQSQKIYARDAGETLVPDSG